jgi:hypothetical protein
MRRVRTMVVVCLALLATSCGTDSPGSLVEPDPPTSAASATPGIETGSPVFRWDEFGPEVVTRLWFIPVTWTGSEGINGFDGTIDELDASGDLLRTRKIVNDGLISPGRSVVFVTTDSDVEQIRLTDVEPGPRCDDRQASALDTRLLDGGAQDHDRMQVEGPPSEPLRMVVAVFRDATGTVLWAERFTLGDGIESQQVQIGLGAEPPPDLGSATDLQTFPRVLQPQCADTATTTPVTDPPMTDGPASTSTTGP